MTVQASITNEPSVGAAGMIYDSAQHHDIQTYIAQEDIPYGSYVRISGGYCELPDTSGEVTGKGGVAVRDNVMRPTGVGYLAGDAVPVMTVGRIWVATEQAIAAQASPFIRFAAGAGGSAKGAWRNDADTASAVQVAAGVHMYRGVGGAGFAVVELGRAGA